MDNPFLLPAPDDPIERIHHFARDLAYGAISREWQATIDPSHNIQFQDGMTIPDNVHVNIKRFYEKWEVEDFSRRDGFILLESFGYVKRREIKPSGMQRVSSTVYDLTEKAFTLLEQPIVPPSVFISYKQTESSALALLIESRLKIADPNIGVFIDKQLKAGDTWHQMLEEKVRGCKYFISLLTPKTLASPVVQKEIGWALDAGCEMRVICHSGFEIPKGHQLNNKHALIIKQESAEEYERTLLALINSMGYETVRL